LAFELSNTVRQPEQMRYKMKCPAIENKLSAYQDAELSASEMEEVGRHLAHCQACREQYEKLQRAWQTLSDLQDIPTPSGFYRRVSRKIHQTNESGLLGRLLPSPALAATALALGILFGTYLGNSLVRFQPFHGPAAFPEENLMSSLKVFDPVPPGTLADGYERLMSYNESHAK
jgi:Putative zinc-finger